MLLVFIAIFLTCRKFFMLKMLPSLQKAAWLSVGDVIVFIVLIFLSLTLLIVMMLYSQFNQQKIQSFRLFFDQSIHSFHLFFSVPDIGVGGSTNTLAALRIALSDPHTHAIYLLTDGRPDQVSK